MRNNQDDEQILVFRVGQVVCSVASRLIESIVDNQTLHRFPGQADFILGVLYYRDHAVSIVNLFNKFGVAEPRANRDSCFIMGSTVHGMVGFWVDEVLEVTTQYDFTETAPPVFPDLSIFERALLWNDKLVLQTDLNCLFSMSDATPLQHWVEKTEDIAIPLPEMNYAVEPVDEISWNQAVYDASIQEIGSLMSRGAEFTHETVALLDDEALSAENASDEADDYSGDEYTEEQLSLFFQSQMLTEYERVVAQPVSQFNLSFNPALETPPALEPEVDSASDAEVEEVKKEAALEIEAQPEPPLTVTSKPKTSSEIKSSAPPKAPKEPVLSPQRKKEKAIESRTVKAIAEKYGDVRQIIDNNISVSPDNAALEKQREKIEAPVLSVSQAEVPRPKLLKITPTEERVSKVNNAKAQHVKPQISKTELKTHSKAKIKQTVAAPVENVKEKIKPTLTEMSAKAVTQPLTSKISSVETEEIKKPAVVNDTAFLHTSFMMDDFDEPDRSVSLSTQQENSQTSSILATVSAGSSMQTKRRDTANTNYSSDFSDSISLDYLDDDGEPFAFSSDLSESSLDSTSEFSVLEEGVDSFIPLQRKSQRSKRDEAVEKVANRIVRKQEATAGASPFRFVASILLCAFFVFLVQHYWMNDNDEIMANVPRLQLLEERDSFNYQKMEATLETVADKFGDEYSLKRPLQKEIVTLDEKPQTHFSLADNVLQGSVR